MRATYPVGVAVDEKHRQLPAIEANSNRATQDIDRLIAYLDGEITQQNNLPMAERANLAGPGYTVTRAAWSPCRASDAGSAHRHVMRGRTASRPHPARSAYHHRCQ